MQFKIDFLKPGNAFPKNTIFFRLKKRYSGVHVKISDQLIGRVGTSITTLVISFSMLVSACIFFYVGVYLPREKRLLDEAVETQAIEKLVKSLKSKRQQEQAQWDAIKLRINQLMHMKDKTVTWTDKLKAINRNLVGGIWIESLEVKQKAAVKVAKKETKKNNRRKNRKKRGKKEKSIAKGKNVGRPSQILVSIRGATYAFLENKPLKLVSEFMKNLMNDPVWERNFDLADWTITTSEANISTDDEEKVALVEELQKNLKTISFRLELERKR